MESFFANGCVCERTFSSEGKSDDGGGHLSQKIRKISEIFYDGVFLNRMRSCAANHLRGGLLSSSEMKNAKKENHRTEEMRNE
jgi:hypothetical protein